MNLPKSTYYHHLRKASEPQEQEDQALKAQIEQVRLDFPTYGYRRLHEHFRRQGQVINNKGVRPINYRFLAKRKHHR